MLHKMQHLTLHSELKGRMLHKMQHFYEKGSQTGSAPLIRSPSSQKTSSHKIACFFALLHGFME
ncbi:hypothetical protein, partial [Paenibacillus sp. CF384]|uniref:hypothetical protein n=1 Tax=Paenibacillus sp. CF384 TaxID=1884382 RepID=UPI001C434D85